MAHRHIWIAAIWAVAALGAACDTAPDEPGAAPQTDEVVSGARTTDTTGQSVPRSPWPRLQSDGIHDPSNAALALLQQPEEALSLLPEAPEGNHVDWVAALRNGAIAPRTNIFPETKITVLESDVVLEDTAGMPRVLFPHKAHTEWLDCQNCHDKIFKPVRGANSISMQAILQGEFCGQCHGAVAFPLTQCLRCHSLPPRAALPGGAGTQGNEPAS